MNIQLYYVKAHTTIKSSSWQRDHWGGVLCVCYCLSLLWCLGWALIRPNWTFATCPQWRMYLCVLHAQGLTGKWDGSFREALGPRCAGQMKISEGQCCQSMADRPHEQWLGLRPQQQQGRELQHPRNPFASSGEGEGCVSHAVCPRGFNFFTFSKAVLQLSGQTSSMALRQLVRLGLLMTKTNKPCSFAYAGLCFSC